MLQKVVDAYAHHGYRVDFGSPDRLYSMIIDLNRKRTINCSGGFTVSDAFMFTSISRIITPQNILVIGNSFGLSTFVLAELFTDSHIDAIDAELENVEPQLGSEITRKISKTHFPNVHFTKGFSPDDLPHVAKGKKYNFIFVDAMHTNEAVLKDYYGIREMIAEDCFVYFHDVANCKMLEAWDQIKVEAHNNKMPAYEFGFTQMGCTAILNGYKDLEKYLSMVQNPFSGPYLNGYTSSNQNIKLKRPFFWDMSFGQLETLVRRKFRRK